jgi:hypothetical protein
VMRGAKTLSISRAFRCRSKRQSVMERFAKAKFDTVTLLRRSQIGVLPGTIARDCVFGRYLGDNFSQKLERSGACRNN